MFVCSNLCGGYLKVLAFLSPNLEVVRAECLIILARQMNYCSCLGKRLQLRQAIGMPKAWKEKLGRGLLFFFF